jgi:ribosome-binding factor A
MKAHRPARINSLLQEVLMETLRKDAKNPHIHTMTVITRVEATVDLHYAKVYVSVLASEKEQESTLKALNSAAGFIAVNASKKVSLRFFPELNFRLDRSSEYAAHIDQLLKKVIPGDSIEGPLPLADNEVPVDDSEIN